jgi:hypothetical protein
MPSVPIAASTTLIRNATIWAATGQPPFTGGLLVAGKHIPEVGGYQEIRIRHFEQAVDRYVAMPPHLPGR